MSPVLFFLYETVGIFYRALKWCKIDLRFILHLIGIEVTEQQQMFPRIEMFVLFLDITLLVNNHSWMQYFLLYLLREMLLVDNSWQYHRKGYDFLTLPCSVVLYVHLIYLMIVFVKYKSVL